MLDFIVKTLDGSECRVTAPSSSSKVREVKRLAEALIGIRACDQQWAVETSEGQESKTDYLNDELTMVECGHLVTQAGGEVSVVCVVDVCDVDWDAQLAHPDVRQLVSEQKPEVCEGWSDYCPIRSHGNFFSAIIGEFKFFSSVRAVGETYMAIKGGG